jgi:CHAT domain-containing protein/tetratricopeptide (TPR) repeat protein
MISALLQHLSNHGRLVVCCLLVILASTAEAHAQAADDINLTLGQILQREIGGGETHTYTLELKAGQYARILVEQEGIDVVSTIFGLDGNRTVVDRPNSSRGREVVSYIARQDGTYRLEIRTLERAAPRGHYRIAVSELRASGPRDESRLAAEHAVTEGEDLRARKTALSLPQALDKFDQAIALWRALDEPYETAVALYGRCLAHRHLGSSERAVEDCEESLRIMREVGDDYGEAVALTGRAWSYIYLGDTDKALSDFTLSLSTRRRIGDLQGEALDLLGVGWAYILRGEYAKAVEYFQSSIKSLDRAGDPRGKATRLASIGEAYRRTGQYALAVEYLNRALELSRATNSERSLEADTLSNLGWCYYALGQLTQAKETFADALPMRRAVGDRTGEAMTLLGLAHVEREQSRLQDARLHVESALAVIESLRSQVRIEPLRISYFALTQDFYDFYIGLLMQMHRLDPSRGFAATALEASERARARNLLDLLNESHVDVRQGISSELLELERLLHTKLNSAADFQTQLLSENHTSAQAMAAAKGVDDLSTELSEAEAKIRQASPRYAELTQPEPLTAAAIQREVVDADTLLLEYALGKERSYLWAVTPEAIHAYELPPGAEIESEARRVRELLTAREISLPGETPAQKRARVAQADAQYSTAAAHLSNTLLAPAATQLGTNRLVIVAPGTLQLISFGALPQPSAPDQPTTGSSVPLIVGHEVVSVPSASTLRLLRRYPAQRGLSALQVAVIADPIFSLGDERFLEISSGRDPSLGGTLRVKASVPSAPEGVRDNANLEKGGGGSNPSLPRLFRTRWEAEKISEMLPPDGGYLALDFAANRATATGKAVAQSRIIHFATHAIIDDAHPELSGIALSTYDRDGRPQDGFLRAHDIFNLKLSAGLVVLSACRTSLGRDVRGEGLISLARAFMYAGAPRFVGSLWSTDDKATAELMVSFYKKMLKENMRPAAALRAAQVEMWRDGRWQSPYYWGAFVLQGEWR